MALLIDGYNLLHAAGVFPPETTDGSLADARHALVDFLSSVLPAKELPKTTIVFDAQHAPPGLPRVVERGGITLLFAPRRQSADELLAELIDQHRTPKELTVVSSDHQVQRAARRRGARWVDSDAWHREIVAAHRQSQQPAELDSGEAHKRQTATGLSEGEVAFWLDEFREPRRPPPKKP